MLFGFKWWHFMTLRLIIADDNAQFLDYVKTVAEAKGWLVTLCADGNELLAILKEMSDPALVLVDINMPNLDGVEVAWKLSDLNGSAPARLRFITGGDPTNAIAARMIAKAREQDPGTTLFKPIAIEKLREVLAFEAEKLEAQQLS